MTSTQRPTSFTSLLPSPLLPALEMPDLFYFAHAHQVESEEEDEVEGRLRAIEVERGILRRALDAPEDLESRETLVDHLHQQHSLYDLLECDIPIHLSPVDRQGLAAQLDGMQTILSILDSGEYISPYSSM